MHDFAVTLDTAVGPLQVVAESAMAIALERNPRHDPGVEYFMRRHQEDLFPFFDVGANIGYFSLLAATMGGPVIAVEPDERNLILLRENLADSDVTVFPVACSSHDGVISMGTMTCGRSAKSRENMISLPSRSIRSLVAELGLTPAFVKLDIEGGETDALLGLEGPECASSILEVEFSWRDHGRRFDEWLRIRPPGPYRWDFLLAHNVGGAESISLAGRDLFLAGTHDVQSLTAIIDTLKEHTDKKPSSKWELCIIPRTRS